MTSTFTASIDTGHAARLLRRIEAHHDEQGWHPHANMHAYVVYDHHDVVTAATIEQVMRSQGEPVRTSRYSAQPMLSSQFFAAFDHVSPPTALFRTAFTAAYADTGKHLLPDHDPDNRFAGLLGQFRELLRMPGILGFAACSEMHLLFEDNARFAHQVGIGFGDLPDAVELRMAVMVDVQNQVNTVVRKRGEQAEINPASSVDGIIVNALRLYMDTAAARLPQDQAGYDARYPDNSLS